MKSKFRSFNDAKKYARSLNLQSVSQWKKIKHPDDIPRVPYKSYSNYWKDWGDFLGIEIVANQNRKFKSFLEAKKYALALNLESLADWKKLKHPYDIPRNPDNKYKAWKGWGDFLGTGIISNINKKKLWRNFEEARQYARSLKLKSRKEWNQINHPKDIPRYLESTYKNKWTTMGDFLGIDPIYRKNWRPFKKAKEYAISLKLRFGKQWSKIDHPKDIPKNPSDRYKSEWKGWGDFLGTGNISVINKKKLRKSFQEARKYARSLKLKHGSQWSKIDHPIEIPKSPRDSYSKEWQGWGDFLNSDYIPTRNRNYRTFTQAKKYARSLNLKSQKEWFQINSHPEDIPRHVDGVYKKDWIDWGDFLGTGYIANQKRKYASFENAKKYARSLKLKYGNIWQTVNHPKSIPNDPRTVYRKQWVGWNDFLGSKHLWSRLSLVVFLKNLKPIINSVTASELYAILKANNIHGPIAKLDANSPEKKLLNYIYNNQRDDAQSAFKEIELKYKELKNSEEELIETHISNIEENIDDNVRGFGSDFQEELPNIKSNNILNKLDFIEEKQLISDEETIKFLINKSVGSLWSFILRSAQTNIESVFKKHNGGKYSKQLKKIFLNEYSGVKSLKLPMGYEFKINGKKIAPNLMQKLIAYKLQKEKRIGNWSGTGSGKTLGAILASRIINAKITVIIGLNNTIIDPKAGWGNEISSSFPNSNVQIKERYDFAFKKSKPNYLLLNYESFQLDSSKELIDSLIQNFKVDMIILDEIHSTKSSSNVESKRRKLINYFLLEAEKKNKNLHVLGMSATPVVNDLSEAVSLIEMIKGRKYPELDTEPKISNALSIHEQLVINGIRYMPNYKMHLSEKNIELTDQSIIQDLMQVGRGQLLKIEQVLLQVKKDTVLELLKPGTIIFSHYVEGIFEPLKKLVADAGYKVATFNGLDKTGINDFKNREAEVLIGSSALGTGIDGLQYICNRMIIITLPWTSASYEQLIGRIYRQGSKFEEVEILIPQVVLEHAEEKWSWDKQRLARIKYKKTLADAAVDGVIPEGNLINQTKMLNEAKQALNNWIERLEKGELKVIDRKKLSVPLPKSESKKLLRNYGDFSQMNQTINSSKSSTIHKRFNETPEEWYQYHTLYSQARKEWLEIPYKVIAEYIKVRPDWIVGDFGCGEALLAKELPNKVFSFDHIAINPSVIVSDLSKLNQPDKSLDVGVFALSLMSTNWQDYLKEAQRVIKPGGFLYIAEPKNRWVGKKLDILKSELQSNKFSLQGAEEIRNNFIYITAIKIVRRS